MMASHDHCAVARRAATRPRRVVALILAACLLFSGCQRTPQLGGNEECLGAADALWTAVTAKDSELVNASEAKIKQLHTDGKLPAAAFEVLKGVIARTRAGDWDDARGDLKAFVRGQRPATTP